MGASRHTAGVKLLPLTKAPESLCLLRLSALGDVTHALPVVEAIREFWPTTRISWIIGKLEYQLLKHLPDIEFLVFDKKHSLREAWKLRRLLANRQFDLLLHMQVALRANLLSKVVNSPIRLGWDEARGRDGHSRFVNHQVAAVARQHQAQGFLSFARAIGLSVREPEWRLPLPATAKEFAERHLPGDQPVLVISPCSSHSLRNWSSAGYAAVAEHAAFEMGMRVVLSGGPGTLERRMAAEIERRTRAPLLNLVGRDTLQQSLGVLKKASLVISPDSGPAHIANALGTPVLGLYAATWSRRSGPYNSLDLCVDRFPEAARRFLGKEPRELRWGTKIEKPGVMDLITVDAVIGKLREWRNPPETIELPVVGPGEI